MGFARLSSVNQRRDRGKGVEASKAIGHPRGCVGKPFGVAIIPLPFGVVEDFHQFEGGALLAALEDIFNCNYLALEVFRRLNAVTTERAQRIPRRCAIERVEGFVELLDEELAPLRRGSRGRLSAAAELFGGEGAQCLFDVLAAATPGHFSATVTPHSTAHEISPLVRTIRSVRR